MKSKLLEIAVMTAALSAPIGGSLAEPIRRGEYAPNGNSRRSHKLNVKRKKLRRLKNKAIQASRKR